MLFKILDFVVQLPILDFSLEVIMCTFPATF